MGEPVLFGDLLSEEVFGLQEARAEVPAVEKGGAREADLHEGRTHSR